MRRFSHIVVRNSAFGVAAQLAIKLLSFAFTVLVVRQLGVESYGQYAAVLAFGALFIFLADLGLSPFAVREVAQRREGGGGVESAGALYGNLLTLRFILALITAALLIGAAWATARPPQMVIAIALGTIGLVLYSAQGAADAVLTGFERLDITSAARVVYQMVFVILGAVALWLGAGYFGLIYANLAGIAIMTLICVGGARSLGVRPTGAQPGQWPTLLRASVPFGVIGFTLGLSYRFDSVLLNLTRGDVETGYYNAVYNLVFSMVLLSNVVNSALYPSLARQRRSAPHTLPAIYERALRYLLMLALPIAVGASVLADRIVPFLFTEAYAPASPALRIVIWVVPLMYLSEFLGYVVVVAGRERRVARAVMLSTACNILLNLLVVPRYGFVAAAATTVLTELVLAGQYLWMLRGDLAAVRWGHVLGRPLLAALLMGALELALPPLPLPISVATGAIAYLVALLALGVIGPDEWRFVRELRRPAEVAP